MFGITSLINDSSSWEEIRKGNICSINDFSSSQMEHLGFGGIITVLIESAVMFLALSIISLLTRKIWNFGRLALVYDADSSDDMPYQMPQDINKELDEDHGFLSSVKALVCMKYGQTHERCGEDARHYLAFQTHAIYFLFVATFMAMCVILPLNIMGNFAINNTGYFRYTTMTNVHVPDYFLWLHAAFGFLMSAGMVFFITKHLLSIHYNQEGKVQYSISIDGLPRNADEETIKKHFHEAFPTCIVESIHLGKYISKLLNISDQSREASKKLAYYYHLLQTTGQQANLPTPLTSLCCPGKHTGQPTNAIDHYQGKVDALEKEYKEEMEKADKTRTGTAYVTFMDKSMAELVLKAFNSGLCHRKPQSSVGKQLKTSRWSVSCAHNLQDILWKNMGVCGWKWWARFIGINVFLMVVLTVATTPEFILTNTMNKALAYSPSLQLWIFSFILRSLVYYSTPLEKHWHKSEETRMMMYKMFFYLTFTVLIAPMFGLSSLYQLFGWVVDVARNVTAPTRLECLFWPHQGAEIIHYVINAALMGNAMDLLRMTELLTYGIRLVVARSTARRLHIMHTQAREFPYGEMYARMLCVISIVMTYSSVSPLVVPFGLIYMILRHLTDMHNLYYVHIPSKLGKSVHTDAAKLTMVAPIFCLLWQFLSCLLRKGFAPVTTVLALSTFVMILVAEVYVIFGSSWQTNMAKNISSQQSSVHDMGQDKQEAQEIKPQVEDFKFYKNFP